MARLSEKQIPQRRIAAESGVPFSTVCKIAQGAVREPSVHSIQKLYDYFTSVNSTVNPENTPNSESPVAAHVECCSGDPRYHPDRCLPDQRKLHDRREES